jgi:microcystin-dependent protein
MTQIAPLGWYRAFDANGNPLAGGKLYTYEAGTSTPKATYTTAAGNIANSNPVILDADGYADVWLETGGYKFVLTDSNDVLQREKDNITGGGSVGFASQVVSRSSSFSLGINDQNVVNVCTEPLTVSLLPAATAGNGFVGIVVNLSSGNVTIDPDGSETINNASTLVIGTNGNTTLTCDGSEWYTLGLDSGSTLLQDSLWVGKVDETATLTAPARWLFARGQAISRTTYSALFEAIGTTYGAGDGSTTFNVPDIGGRVVAGSEASSTRLTSGVSGIDGATLGAAGGSEAMQEHTHGVTDPGHTHAITGATNTGLDAVSVGPTVTQKQNALFDGQKLGIVSATTGITIQNTGTGTSQNVQPTIVLHKIIYAGV